MKKMTGSQFIRIIQATILFVFVVYIAAYLMNQVSPHAPFDINDFVVSKEKELVISSNTDSNLYIYSNRMELVKVIKGPSCNGPVITIDDKSNIYMLCGNNVYFITGDKVLNRIGAAPLKSSQIWRLTREGIVEHIEKWDERAAPFTSTRLRHIAKAGDILFYQSEGTRTITVEDPFYGADGLRYEYQGWLNGIVVFSPEGQREGEFRLPLLARIFMFPYPGVYIVSMGVLLLIGSSYLNRKKLSTARLVQ